MRIGPSSIIQQDDRCVLEAEVSLATGGVDVPPSLRFATEGGESFFAPDMADAFVVGLIASAMHLGEDIRVESPVSARLAHGLETYQDILSSWWPDTFRRVDIRYESLLDRRHDLRPEGVGCTFSGGVDSYHAVWQLLPENVKCNGFSITRALMINGFDQLYDPERKHAARKMYDVYRSMLGEWGVELLMIDSNLKSFRNAVLKKQEQVHSYGSALTACAHALGGYYGRFCIAGHGSYAYEDLEPYGSHAALDHHLSSDQLQVIHTGTGHTRSEKTEILADFPQVRKSLSVCFAPPKFDHRTGMPVNCCQCEKCVRTMVALIIIGKLDKFSTFAKHRYPLAAYRNPNNLRAIHENFLEDMMNLANRHGKQDWVATLEEAREKRREWKQTRQDAR